MNSLISDQLEYALLVFRRGVIYAPSNHLHTLKTPCLRIDGSVLTSKVAYEHDTSIIYTSIDACLQRRANQLDHQVNTARIMHNLAYVLLLVIDHHISP